MNDLVTALRAREADYQPRPEVAEALSSVTFVPIIGPFAVGKSTCISKAVTLDPEFGCVQSFTTRDIRPGEDRHDFRWLSHDEPHLDNILAAVEAGELVQYAVHPTTGRIYGSDLRDYAYPYAILDTLASSVPSLRALPFRAMKETALVVSADEWRVMSRPRLRQISADERHKRLREGSQSLAWSLEEGDTIAWVRNHHGAVTATAKEVIGLARGQCQPDLRNRRLGEQLLKHIDDLLAA